MRTLIFCLLAAAICIGALVAPLINWHAVGHSAVGLAPVLGLFALSGLGLVVALITVRVQARKRRAWVMSNVKYVHSWEV